MPRRAKRGGAAARTKVPPAKKGRSDASPYLAPTYVLHLKSAEVLL